MKSKSLQLIIFFFMTASCFAQKATNPKVGDTIVLKNWCKVTVKEKLNTNVENALPGTFVDWLEPGVKFRVNSITPAAVQLVALDYRKLSDENLAKYSASTPGFVDKSNYYNSKAYTISRADFDNSSAYVVEDHIITGGLVTLPFKARPQGNFTFDTEFNINTTLNIRFAKINSANFNGQFGAGIGTVNLNSATAAGVESDKAQDVAVLSFLGGLMLQYKKVQAGLYFGVDQINNQSKYRWESNGKIWIGFGVGISLYKISLGGASNKQD